MNPLETLQEKSSLLSPQQFFNEVPIVGKSDMLRDK